ncbi:MAG: aminotransferase class V-fold PLP-dependent enzyme [Syntrophobacterales bacterium]|nr:MAG: aminotransferase class V-fold PLP-dependent enzyme [Syntrophobacterales bacterium]
MHCLRDVYHCLPLQRHGGSVLGSPARGRVIIRLRCPVKSTYRDHSGHTPMRSKVLESMHPYSMDIFGNASSIHTFGQKAKVLEDPREGVATILGASHEEIVFTD